MQCNCGGETRESTHEVKTLGKAQEWDSTVTPGDLPIRVQQDRCPGCGRSRVTIYRRGLILARRG